MAYQLVQLFEQRDRHQLIHEHQLLAFPNARRWAAPARPQELHDIHVVQPLTLHYLVFEIIDHVLDPVRLALCCLHSDLLAPAPDRSIDRAIRAPVIASTLSENVYTSQVTADCLCTYSSSRVTNCRSSRGIMHCSSS